MQPDTASRSQTETLSLEQRQALMEALYRRFFDGGDASVLDPARLAKLAVMTDQELLSEMLAYESDGDEAVAQVLARLGLSERPVEIRMAAEDAGIPDGPSVISVYVSVALLRRFSLEHFSVRDIENFGSLRIDLPDSDPSIGYPSEDAVPQFHVLKSRAVLLNGAGSEAFVAFEVECARDGDFDVPLRTAAARLEDLRSAVAQSVGHAELVRFGDADGEAWLMQEPSSPMGRDTQRGD